MILPLPPELPGSMALHELARLRPAAEGSRVKLRQCDVGRVEQDRASGRVQLRYLDREPRERLRGNG